MRVPAVTGPSVQQDPLRVPTTSIDAGPAAFGLGIAQAGLEASQQLAAAAEKARRDTIEVDVSENVAAAQDVSNQAVTRAHMVTGPEATEPKFLDPYDKDITKGWVEAAKNAKTPQARAIIKAKGDQDRVMSLDAIRNHSAQQFVQYKKVANELVVTKETQAAALAPEDAKRQASSEANITAMVRANLKGAKKEEVDTAVAEAVSGMYLTVAKGISDKNPGQAQTYYETYKDKIVEGDEKKTFEDALAVKTDDFAAEMLARQAVADPKNKTIEDVYSWLQKATAGEKTVGKYDKSVPRATTYFNAKMKSKSDKETAFFENAYMRLHTSGYDIDVFTTGDIAQMTPHDYEFLKGAAADYWKEKAAAAVAKGELTPARAGHVQAWANFQSLLTEEPRFLVEGHDFVKDWSYKLGPEYVDEGMKAWRAVQYDMANPGSRTVESDKTTYVVQNVLRRSFPKLFPPEDSPSQWNKKASAMFLNVEHYLNERIKLEQTNHPGKDPTPDEIQAWTVDAIKNVKTRADGKVTPAYALSPEQARDPNVVIPEDEQKFRDFYIPYHRIKSDTQSAPSDAEVRQKYVKWIADGRPPFPPLPSKWEQGISWPLPNIRAR